MLTRVEITETTNECVLYLVSEMDRHGVQLSDDALDDIYICVMSHIVQENITDEKTKVD